MMRECRGVPLLISRSLDDDLPPDAASALASHLAVCEKCRRRAADYAALRKLVAASFSDRPLPVGAVAALIARTPRAAAAPRRPFCRLRLAGAGFTLTAAAAAVFFLSPPHRTAAVPPSFLLESSHPGSMCVPLSALIYYEEYAGKAVLSQFVKVAPQRKSGAEAVARTAVSYYESPLLGDNAAIATGGVQE